MAISLTDSQVERLQSVWEELGSANNAVVGCAMFAPDESRKRDLPRLVEKLANKERALQELLEDWGFFD